MAIRIRRREFIGALGGAAAAWPFVARAQHAPGKVAHVGIIDDSPSWDPFRQRLRELNYVEGQNIAYVYLRTDGSPAQLDSAAAALVQVPVNVIVAFGTPRAQAAQRATKTIPIVAISISDPIAAGLARISHTIFARSKSFARRLDSRFRNVLARGAGGRERSWDSIGAAGWQQTIDLGGPGVMPRFLRVAAARVRPANRARLRQH